MTHRWAQYIVIMSVLLVTCILRYTGKQSKFGGLNPRALLLKDVDPRNPIPTWALALVANLPQLALSGLYYLYNGLYTSMLLSHEWTKYATHRQPLRVQQPIGQQRLAYWLTVPLPLAVPVVATAAVAHWLQSQAMFLAFVNIRDSEGRPFPLGIHAVGYSPAAMVATIVEQLAMMVAILSMGWLRYPAGIPLVRGCSLAISAACHPLPHETDPAVRELKYGVLADRDEQGNELVGLSSEPVEPLDPKKVYGKGMEVAIN